MCMRQTYRDLLPEAPDPLVSVQDDAAARVEGDRSHPLKGRRRTRLAVSTVGNHRNFTPSAAPRAPAGLPQTGCAEVTMAISSPMFQPHVAEHAD
jgi:hypothetical protein